MKSHIYITMTRGIVSMFISLFLRTGTLAYAQEIYNYEFEVSTTTYTELSSASNVPFPAPIGGALNTDNNFSNAVSIPFNFRYMGKEYNQFRVSTNGFIVLGTGGADNNQNNLRTGGGSGNSATAANANLIAPLWDDLDILNANNLKYAVTGSAPERVLIVQWKDIRWTADVNPASTVKGTNFQLRLYEGSNNIEFHYGSTNPVAGLNTTVSASIGLIGECFANNLNAGNRITDDGNNNYIAVDVNTTPISVFYSTPYSGTTPTQPATISSNARFSAGTVFRFIHPVYSVASGYWDSPGVWNTSVVPNSTSTVMVSNGTAVDVPAGYEAKCKKLIIGHENDLKGSTTAATVNLEDRSSTLTVSGGFPMALRMSTSDVFAVPVNVSGDYALLNVGKGKLTVAGHVNLNGIHEDANGLFASLNSSILVDAGGKVTISGNLGAERRSCRSVAGANAANNSFFDMSTGASRFNITGALNDGISYSFGPGSAVNFNGSSAQTNKVSGFDTLKINNTAGVLLAVPITTKHLLIGDEVQGSILKDRGNQITGSVSGKMRLSAGSRLLLGGTTSTPPESMDTEFPANYLRQNIKLESASSVEYVSLRTQRIADVPEYYHLKFTKFNKESLSLSHDKICTRLIGGSLIVKGTLTSDSEQLPSYTSGGSTFNDETGKVNVRFDGSGTATHTIEKLVMLGTMPTSSSATPGNLGEMSVIGTYSLLTINISGDFEKTAGKFIANDSSATVVYSIGGNVMNKGDFTVNNRTGHTTFNVKGNFVIEGNQNDLNNALGNGSFTVNNGTGTGLLTIEGDFTKKVNNLLTVAKGSGKAELTVSKRNFTIESSGNNNANTVVVNSGTGDDALLHVAKTLDLKAGSLKVSNSAGLATLKTDSLLQLSGGSFTAANSTGSPDITLANVRLSSGNFIGAVTAVSPEINISNNVTVTGGTFACAQRQSVLGDVVGDPEINIGGDVAVSGGTFYLTSNSTPSAGGGHTDLNVGGSFRVSGAGNFYGVFGDADTKYNGRLIFKNKDNPRLEDTLRLNTGFAETDAQPQYSIIIESRRTLRMISNIELGTKKALQVDGALHTNNFLVRKAGPGNGTADSTTFTLSPSGLLDVSSVYGIRTTTDTGSVRTKFRTYSTGARYRYSQTVAQAAGNGLPAAVSELIVNSRKLTLPRDLAVSDRLSFQADNQVLNTIHTRMKTRTNPGDGSIDTFYVDTAYTVTLGAGAVSKGMNEQRFVRGKLQKVMDAGTDQFSFYVGDFLNGKLFGRPFTVTKTVAGEPLTMLVQLVAKKADKDTFFIRKRESTVEAVNDYYYYRVHRSVGSDPVDISIRYNPSDSGILDASALNIASWKDGANGNFALAQWKDAHASNDVALNLLTVSGFNNFNSGADTTPIALSGKNGSNNFAHLSALFKAEPRSVCVGDTVVFTDLSPGFPDGFSWNFGSGSSPSTSGNRGPVKVIYNTSGMKTIQLIVTKNGETPDVDDTLTLADWVEVTTQPVTEAISPDAPTGGCKGDTLTFFLSSSSSSATYTWSVSNGGSIIRGQGSDTARIAFSRSGNITVSVRKTVNGCQGTTRTRLVSIKSPALGEIIGNTGACLNSALTYLVDADAAASFLWKVSGGAIQGDSTTNSVNVLWNTHGAGQISIRKVKNGCTDTRVEIIYVSTLVAAVTNDTTLCYGQQVQLNAEPQGGTGDHPAYSYQWRVKGESTPFSTAKNAKVTPDTTTVYYLSVQDDNCNSASIEDSVLIVVRDSLDATVSPDQVLCEGDSIQLSASASGGLELYNYTWAPPEGLDNPASAAPFAKPSATRTYIVTISDGCSTPITRQVKVTVNPKPAIPVITGNTTACNGDQVILTATNATTWQWFLNGQAAAGETNQTYTFIPANNDQVYVVVTNNFGCSATSAGTTVTVNQRPAEPVISGNQTVCSGSQLTLTSTGATTYQWYVNDLPINGATGQSYTFVPLNNNQVHIVVGNDVGCTTASVKVTIVVNQSPATPAITGNQPVCSGNQLTLTASAAPGYQWYVNDQPVNGATGQNYTFVPVNNDQVHVIVRNNSGCSASSSKVTIVVNQQPATPAITGNNPVCEGDALTLTSSAATGNQWYLNGAVVNGETGSTYTFIPADDDRVYVMVANGNCTASSPELSVTVNARPIADFTFSPDTAEVGKNVSFTETGAGGSQYDWNFGDGQSDNGSSVNYQYSAAGTYQVQLRVTAANNCVATITKPIVVKDTSTTGIPEQAGSIELKVYPNPSPGIVQVELAGHAEGSYQVHLFDLRGSLLRSEEIVYFKTITLNYTDMADGLYILEVKGKQISYRTKLQLRMD